MRKRIGIVDLDTGEIEDGVPVWVARRPRSPYDGWVTMNQAFLEELATREDVHGETLRMFVFLSARLSFQNQVLLTQQEIATALRMRRQNVGRAMNKLEELGAILRGPRVGRSYAWRLNPNAGWKGKLVDLRPALKAVE